MVNKYEKMSDLDLNFNVAKAAGCLVPIPRWCEPLSVGDKMCYYDEFRNIWDRHADYCSDESAMMPLVFELKISLEFIDGFGWTASCGSKESSCYDRPLRAAAIVYLMIMEGEHGK